jgi:hypothetical protein
MGTGESLAELLAAVEANYTAESKVEDLMTLQERISGELREMEYYSDNREASCAAPNADKWHMQRAAIVELNIEKRRRLVAQLEDAKANLLRLRGIEPENVAAAQADDVFWSEMPGQQPPTAVLSPSNFDR